MLTCPRCHHGLGRVMSSGTSYWSCAACGGHAINISVFRKVAVGSVINEIWQTAQAKPQLSALKCPACLKEMNISSIFIRTDPLEVDVCRRCQFLWFDGLELSKIPALPKPPPPEVKELPQAMREKLALLEVERLRRQAQLEEFNGPVVEANWQAVAGYIGFPVEVDPPELKRYPLMTWSISLFILLMSIWGFVEGEDFIRNLAFLPSEPFRHGGLTWLTSFFIHAGIIHLVSNLYFFLIFGDNVEDFIGKKRFLIVLILSTFAGDLLHFIADPRADIPSLGASGGISGIITLYALAFPQARIGFMLRYWFRFHWINFSARTAMVLWVGIQLVIAWMQVEGKGNVSALAHLGGCSIGFLYWLVVLSPRKLPVKPAG